MKKAHTNQNDHCIIKIYRWMYDWKCGWLEKVADNDEQLCQTLVILHNKHVHSFKIMRYTLREEKEKTEAQKKFSVEKFFNYYPIKHFSFFLSWCSSFSPIISHNRKSRWDVNVETKSKCISKKKKLKQSQKMPLTKWTNEWKREKARTSRTVTMLQVKSITRIVWRLGIIKRNKHN